jgi:hypothetical protein
MMPFIGVRSSWLTVARNWSLRLAGRPLRRQLRFELGRPHAGGDVGLDGDEVGDAAVVVTDRGNAQLVPEGHPVLLVVQQRDGDVAPAPDAFAMASTASGSVSAPWRNRQFWPITSAGR